MTEQEAKQRLMPWGWRAEEQWTLARPKHVKELKQSGIFYQSLKRESERAAEMAAMLIGQGVDPFTAEELALDNLFLPPEDLQPILGGPVKTAY